VCGAVGIDASDIGADIGQQPPANSGRQPFAELDDPESDE